VLYFCGVAQCLERRRCPKDDFGFGIKASETKTQRP